MGPESRFPRENRFEEEAGHIQSSNTQSHPLTRTHQSPIIKQCSVIAQKTNIAEHTPNGGRNPPRESPSEELPPPLTNAERWNIRRHLYSSGQQDVEPFEPVWSDLHDSFQSLYCQYVSETSDNPEKGVELFAAVNGICPYTGITFDKAEPQTAQTLKSQSALNADTNSPPKSNCTPSDHLTSKTEPRFVTKTNWISKSVTGVTNLKPYPQSSNNTLEPTKVFWHATLSNEPQNSLDEHLASIPAKTVIKFTTVGSSTLPLPQTWSRLQPGLRVARKLKGFEYFTVAKVWKINNTRKPKGRNVFHEVDQPLLVARLSTEVANSSYTSVSYRGTAQTMSTATSVSILRVWETYPFSSMLTPRPTNTAIARSSNLTSGSKTLSPFNIRTALSAWMI